MTERRAALLRAAVIALVLCNVALLAYILLAPNPHSQALARVDVLQINPGRIKMLGVANRGPAGQTPAVRADGNAAARACLEWGPFRASELPKVEAALGGLALGEAPLRRPAREAASENEYMYFLREPDANVVGRIAELKRAFPQTEIRATACPG